MTLIVEDGSIVADAETYASVSDLQAYVAKRGVSVSNKPADQEILLVKSMDFLRGLNYIGDRTNPTVQVLDWPRAGAWIENWLIRNNEIPRQLIYAQCAIAVEVANGIDVLPTQDVQDPGQIIEEEVGPIRTVYANNGVVRRVPAMAKAEVFLRVLTKRNGLTAIRV
jgi:hypothetical protein